ncbi:MAG: PilZ domain-containing protein, partial [Gammaproteobacteria bacterium]|nr:PilZ domain-containing protein [Gammaproteobacteria bacterium]
RCQNISLSGMQLQCDRMAVTQFAPKGEHTTPDQAPDVTLNFTLPLKRRASRTVTTTAKVIFIRRIAEQEYHVGVEFQSFDEEGHEQIEAYLNETLQRQQL